MYKKLVSFENIEVPKSIILIPVFILFFSITFSGLRSEWTTLISFKQANAFNICIANVLMYVISNGQKLLVYINSYKLILRSYVTMQMCFLKTIKSLIRKMFFQFSTSFYFAFIKILISFNASCICYFLERMILTATCYLFLWSKAFTTSPNAPEPRC